MKYLVLIFAVIFLSSCSKDSAGPTEDNTPKSPYNINSLHVELGVPFDKDTTDDYLIVRYQYVLSYNKNRNVCNWVAWELDSTWYGETDRYSGNFITDTSLPSTFYRVKHDDYTNSGYDRGHMVMSHQRSANEVDNKSTFLLSNVLPQRPNLNRKVWLDFEYFCDSLCLHAGKKLYVVAGGVFHTTTTIGKGVAVPDSCWKIVLVLNPEQGRSHVTSSTEVYSVMMPNSDAITGTWIDYKKTVDQIEASTGYDFMNLIPVNIQSILESK